MTVDAIGGVWITSPVTIAALIFAAAVFMRFVWRNR